MKVLVHILLDVLKLTNEACSKHSPTPFPCLWEQNSDTSSCGERYSGYDDTESLEMQRTCYQSMSII